MHDWARNRTADIQPLLTRGGPSIARAPSVPQLDDTPIAAEPKRTLTDRSGRGIDLAGPSTGRTAGARRRSGLRDVAAPKGDC